jgi:dipeptidyl aminopeptidase/acylaminoacyl peptidase
VSRFLRRAALACRRRLWLLIVVAGLMAAGCWLLDQWLPRMLLDHYKASVDPDPPAFREYGASFETVAFQAEDGVRFAGWFVPADPPGPEPVTLIVLHTLGGSRQDMLRLMLPLWRRGVSLLLMDMRGHGESGGKHFTYGYHEWRDVAEAVTYLKGRSDGAGRNVAVLGASAGGSVALLAAARDRRLCAVIAMGAFADLEEMVKRDAGWLPAVLRRRALRKAEELGRFRVDEASPLRHIAKIRCPILLVHGDRDARVPYENARCLREAARAPTELYTLRGGTHRNLFSAGGEPLWDHMAAFLFRSSEARPAAEPSGAGEGR